MSNHPYFLVGGSETLYSGEIMVEDVHARLHKAIQSYYPDHDVFFVPLWQVRNGLQNKVAEVQRHIPNAFVVSLSNLYYPEADAFISCTRTIDKNFNNLGIVERPGSIALAEQVANVMKLAGNRPVIVVDDTVFHGETTGLISSLGLRIHTIVAYFASADAHEIMSQRNISLHSASEYNHYTDVMPVHDFIPCLPLSGRVVSHQKGGNIEHEIVNGITISRPYIVPYIKPNCMVSWSSIPYDNVHHFSSVALTQAIVIAERLREQGITRLSDLASNQSLPVSLPYIEGQVENTDDILEILRSSVHLAMCKLA